MDSREQVFIGLERLFQERTQLEEGEIFTVPSVLMGNITPEEIAYYCALRGFPVTATEKDSTSAYFQYHEGARTHA